MGKINLFEITLNNLEGVYYPEQYVQGVLTVESREPLKITAIRAACNGKAFVHWTEQHMRGPGKTQYRNIRHHSATEKYMEQAVLLYGKGNKEKCYLPVGRHSYPFQFQLPSVIPSSFEGDHGYIRFWIKGTIEKNRRTYHVTKLPFTVISPLDLNKIPAANEPVHIAKCKKLCCLCCLSGPITASLSLEKRGYVPGEPIRIEAEILNMSSRKVGCSSVELKMTTMFHAAHKSLSKTKQICKLKRGPIGRGDTDIWNGELFQVPPLPPSYLIGCDIIDVRYILELRVDPVGPAFDLTVPVEIFLGTVPIQQVIYENQPRGDQHVTHARHLQQPTSVHILPRQPAELICNPAHSRYTPPGFNVRLGYRCQGQRHENSRASAGHGYSPSNTSSPHSTISSQSTQMRYSSQYAESVFGKTDIRDEEDSEGTRGQLKFAPSYIYYNIWNK